jgi:hypothetical protein
MVLSVCPTAFSLATALLLTPESMSKVSYSVKLSLVRGVGYKVLIAASIGVLSGHKADAGTSGEPYPPRTFRQR